MCEKLDLPNQLQKTLVKRSHVGDLNYDEEILRFLQSLEAEL